MTKTVTFDPTATIAKELNLRESNVAAVVSLLNEGNTIPFIARYRKEIHGSMDEVQIRTIEERNNYLIDMEKRQQAILESIEQQGKLTPELKNKILACSTKASLEDLYLPYKPKRRTKATIAKERGLEPLANRILEQPLEGNPSKEAESFVNLEKEIADTDAALAGARDIVAETIAEHAEIRTLIREKFIQNGQIISCAVKDTKEEGIKFKDYFEYDESVATIPSHRFLAIRRGEREGFLKINIYLDNQLLLERMQTKMNTEDRSPFAAEMQKSVEDSYKRLIAPSVESDVRIDLKMRADKEAVEVFANNLRALLLAAPFGSKSIIGVDPGLRTGCKCAAIDANGNFLSNMTFNIVMGEHAVESGKIEFVKFVQKHNPLAIAVGNGTGGRETEKFIREAFKQNNISNIIVIQVSEAGASVYSASEIAGKEFPQLDLTIRGAISIARRLQDPLAELVKIDPKSIGVGQYQHDVHQPLLGRKLEEVIESCVNGVGVELNTASAPLLAQIAGIGPKTAENIIDFRTEFNGFKNRKQLLKVKGLGPKAFEQAAGFMRVSNGDNPLDTSAVHPERYNLIGLIAKDMNVTIEQLVGDQSLANEIDIMKYVGDKIGEPTLRDIIAELKKPGRDPRKEFEAPAFRDDVNTIADLKEGMSLEGVVTNVTNFGAFVDVGVHRDGLVHISQLADQFVKDPNDVVKVGDKIKVKVLEIDVNRERISFTAKTGNLSSPAHQNSKDTSSPKNNAQQQTNNTQGKQNQYGRKKQPKQSGNFSYNPFANLSKK